MLRAYPLLLSTLWKRFGRAKSKTHQYVPNGKELPSQETWKSPKGLFPQPFNLITCSQSKPRRVLYLVYSRAREFLRSKALERSDIVGRDGIAFWTSLLYRHVPTYHASHTIANYFTNRLRLKSACGLCLHCPWNFVFRSMLIMPLVDYMVLRSRNMCTTKTCRTSGSKIALDVRVL